LTRPVGEDEGDEDVDGDHLRALQESRQEDLYRVVSHTSSTGALLTSPDSLALAKAVVSGREERIHNASKMSTKLKRKGTRQPQVMKASGLSSMLTAMKARFAPPMPIVPAACGKLPRKPS